MKKAFATALVLAGLSFTLVPNSFSQLSNPIVGGKFVAIYACPGGGFAEGCVNGAAWCMPRACNPSQE